MQRSAGVHGVLSSPGRPLPGPVLAEAQARMGADFSRVRVHDDSAARSSAAGIGARAYTSGQHVVLGEGGGDKRTLYHELAHVVQQSRGPVEGTDTGDGIRMSSPGDRHERQADAWADRALSQPEAAVQRALAPRLNEPNDGAGHRGAASGRDRSSAVQRMPRAGKRAAESPPADPTAGKRATRSSRKTFDLSKPKLTFTSAYEGVRTQHLEEQQSIGFRQEATLSRPEGAPQATAYYYHFWQEVADNIVSTNRAGKEFKVPLKDMEQDQKYWPPYKNAVISNTPPAITFTDNPGWSTDRHIEKGQWLKSYEVHFRWKVAWTNGVKWQRGQQADWTSPTVVHRMTSDFDPEEPDAPAKVVAEPAGNHEWTVNLPPREAE
ncbi:DUF4157 domain-containing protein [Streptomyces buecherae]|uniref:eCIS core domain-containing protein n=1 Tax=Streptomyces buecherae TaxID=2763006 RepID=UPI0033FF5810